MKPLINVPILTLIAIFFVGFSIHADYGSDQWFWFQRSGSVVTLIGALLSYRSIVRLGTKGVGGVNTSFLKGTVVSTDDSGPIQKFKIACDQETKKYLYQASIDAIAGYIGAIFILLGTAIWGYGDLLGTLL